MENQAAATHFASTRLDLASIASIASIASDGSHVRMQLALSEDVGTGGGGLDVDGHGSDREQSQVRGWSLARRVFVRELVVRPNVSGDVASWRAQQVCLVVGFLVNDCWSCHGRSPELLCSDCRRGKMESSRLVMQINQVGGVARCTWVAQRRDRRLCVAHDCCWPRPGVPLFEGCERLLDVVTQ